MPRQPLPLVFSSDPDVQAFIETEAWDFNPYADSQLKTPRAVFEAARYHFGDYRCLDLIVKPH
jgi:hypothetical protein